MNVSGLKVVAQNVGKTINKNSPTILTGLAVAGFVTTVIFAVKATPKALEILDQEKILRRDYDNNRPITKKDVIKLTWKTYLPTFLMGATSISCIIFANHINLRRNAMLSSLYALSETTLKEYQNKVIETIGENKEKKIKDEIRGDRIKNNPPKDGNIIITGKGDTLCYDSLSGRYFKSDIETIRKIENETNKRLLSNMWVSLNELYADLGLPGIDLGRDIGWDIDKTLEFIFTSKLTEDGRPCLVIDYMVGPRLSY